MRQAMEELTVSVIIPTHKRPGRVSQLIDSLSIQDFPAKSFQVLLISNLRDPFLRKKARHWKKRFYDFKYMEVGEKGVNKARNLGIRFAGGDILYFLDDDCLLPSAGHLTKLADCHRRWGLVAGIGGGYMGREELKGAGRFYQERQERWVEAVSDDSSLGASQLIGGNASYKREVFDKGLFFDSGIEFGGSEEGLNRRLREYGYSLTLLRELDVCHQVRLSVWSLMRKSFRQGVGHFKNRLEEAENSGERGEKALPETTLSGFSFIHDLFFRMGYFWGLSSRKAGGFFLFKIFYLLFRLCGMFAGRLYGMLLVDYVWRYVTRFFGFVWYILGRLYGMLLVDYVWRYVTRFFGFVWYILGRLYGMLLVDYVWRYVTRFFGFVWYILGRLYGMLLKLYYKTPVAKVWYFSKYQFYKRGVPIFFRLFRKIKKRDE